MNGRSWLLLIITTVAAVAVLSILYLVQSKAGLRSTGHSVDWASHLAMVDLLARGEDVRAHRAEIGTGVVSPLLAHGMTASLTRITGFSTVRSVELIVAFALIVSVAVAGARAVVVGFAVGRNPAARAAACFAAAAAFLFFANIGLGFYGQVTGANFFFSQAVSTAFALIFISAIQVAMTRGGTASLCAIAAIPLLTLFLGKIQLVPALWLAASGMLCILSLDRPVVQRSTLAGAVAVAAVLLLLSLPETRDVLQLPQAERGVFNIRVAIGLLQLNAHPGLLVGGLAVMAMLISLVAVLAPPARAPFAVFNLHAGALAVVLLGVMTLVTLHVRGGGYYGLAKFGYFFAAETALLAGHIAAAALNRGNFVPPRPFWVAPALILMLAAQHKGSPVLRHDQSLLIAFQRELSADGHQLSSPAPLPLDERLSAVERFYLFTGPMRQAKNARAGRLVDPEFERTPAAAREALLPSRIADIVPAWDGKRITLTEPAPQSPLLWFGGWGPVGKEGRPALAPAAHFAFRVGTLGSGKRLCLRVRANNSVEAAFAIDGHEVQGETLPEGASVVELPLTPSAPGGDTVVSILPHGHAAAKAPGYLALQALWLGSTCVDGDGSGF